MNGTKGTESYPVKIKPYVLALSAVWVVIVSASLIWNVYQERQQILDAAYIQASVAFDKDVIYRRWNAEHGGVYIPITDKTQPNPYLNVPEREITTPSGLALTLINPAYMTRQVHELAKETYGVLGHITSLDPIRPENAADRWETQALGAFERGVKEVSSVEEMGGKTYMRLMRPLLTEKGCLKCHAAQGYKLGDIRGGISVALPMTPLLAIEQSHILTLSLGHGLLWLFGMVGIVLGTYRLNNQITERKRSEKEREKLIIKLREALDNVRTLRGLLPICSICKKIRDDEGNWHQVDAYIINHTTAELSHDFCPECFKKWQEKELSGK